MRENEIITKVSERFSHNGTISHYPPDMVVRFILALLAPELEKARMKGYQEGMKATLAGVKDALDKRNEPGWKAKNEI